jgi:hypothetical protein
MPHLSDSLFLITGQLIRKRLATKKILAKPPMTLQIIPPQRVLMDRNPMMVVFRFGSETVPVSKPPTDAGKSD